MAERAQRPGLPAGRQDVIFGGALVLREVMRRFALLECIVSEADILDGLVMSLRCERPGPSPVTRRAGPPLGAPRQVTSPPHADRGSASSTRLRNASAGIDLALLCSRC